MRRFEPHANIESHPGSINAKRSDVAWGGKSRQIALMLSKSKLSGKGMSPLVSQYQYITFTAGHAYLLSYLLDTGLYQTRLAPGPRAVCILKMCLNIFLFVFLLVISLFYQVTISLSVFSLSLLCLPFMFLPSPMPQIHTCPCVTVIPLLLPYVLQVTCICFSASCYYYFCLFCFLFGRFSFWLSVCGYYINCFHSLGPDMRV